MGDGNLAPWDELKYFQTPKEQVVTISSSGIQVFAGDPMCVYLLFAINTSLGVNQLSTISGALGTDGIPVSSTQNFELNFRTHGPLCTVPWFCYTSAVGGKLHVISVSLKEWPQQARRSNHTPDLQYAINSLHKRMTDLLNRQGAMQRVLDILSQGELR